MVPSLLGKFYDSCGIFGAWKVHEGEALRFSIIPWGNAGKFQLGAEVEPLTGEIGLQAARYASECLRP